MTTKKLTPAHTQYAEKDIPPLMAEFAAWLTKETGVPVDARSVYLGSALREKFQKSDGNQKRLAALKKKAAQPKLTATAQTTVTTKKPAPQATPKTTPVRAAAAKPATRKATPKPTTNNAAALAAGVASGHVQILKAGA